MTLSNVAIRVGVSAAVSLLLVSCASTSSAQPSTDLRASAVPNEPECYVPQTEEEAAAELAKLDAAYDSEREAASAAVQAVNREYPDVASTFSFDSVSEVLNVMYLTDAPRERLDSYLADIQRGVDDSSSYPLNVTPSSYAEVPLLALVERLATDPHLGADELGGTVDIVQTSPDLDGSIWVGLLEGAPEAFSVEIEGTTIHVAAEAGPRVELRTGLDDPPLCTPDVEDAGSGED